MKKKNSTKNVMFNSAIRIIVFVLAIVIFGVSTSYAYYVANIKGQANVDESKTATLNVTTTLENAPAISASKMSIINASDYLTKAQKVDFSITNETTSNVKAKYTLKLVEMSITKNLSSKYFKYAVIVNAGKDNEKTFTGNFLDEENIAPENTRVTKDNPETVTGLTKNLIDEDNALILDIGSTDTLSFYIWVENDDNVDQLYLTNGNFSAKLSIDAYPTK